MVSTPITPAQPAEKAETVSAASPLRLMEYWHLLSLDAPTVAIVWSWAFASASNVALHAISAVLLGLATWLLYVADRLLDGFAVRHADSLRERHHFHARHRMAFLAIAFPSLCLLAFLVITRMERAPRHEDLILAGCALVYLLLVHLPAALIRERRTHFFSKEAAVAVIFSAACMIPAWSRGVGMHPWLLFAELPFSFLCWLNCVAIETWEKASLPTHNSWKTITHDRLNKLSRLCLALAAVSLLFAIVLWAQHKTAFALLLTCNAVSAGLLFLLDRKHAQLTPLRLRASADAVLLTPALFLLARYVSHRV